MAAKKGTDSIEAYFNDEEYSNMPDSTKQRYAKPKENYDFMLKLVPSMATESLDMDPVCGLAVNKVSPKFVEDVLRTHQQTTSPRELYSNMSELLASSQQPASNLSSMKVMNEALQSNSYASTLVQAAVEHDGLPLAAHTYPPLCDDCQSSYPGHCPLHGPLTFVKDTPVPSGDDERAMKSVPDGLVIRRTTRRGAQFSVYATKPLTKGLCFGPYEHSDSVEVSAGALPVRQSNWMRYVNHATGVEQHNLVAFRRAGNVFYRTCKAVGTYEELLVSFNASDTEQEQSVTGTAPVDARETQEHNSRGTISCETCAECFSSYEYLLSHQLRQHADRPPGRYKCSHCDYSTDHKFLAAQHEWSHSGEKPFTCGMCQRSFSWRTSLHCHLTSHTGEKPFECADCGERFTCSSHVLRHRKCHTEDARPFVCPVCAKSYARRDYLKVHIRIHTAEKQHACRFCGRRFTDRSNAKRHEMCVHAKQFPLSCPHCAKGFASRSDVRKHVIVHHERPADARPCRS